MLVLLLGGCGDLVAGTESGNPNPRAGTESGNPINPTRPPGFEETPVDSAEIAATNVEATDQESTAQPASSDVDDAEDLVDIPELMVAEPGMDSPPADVVVEPEPAADIGAAAEAPGLGVGQAAPATSDSPAVANGTDSDGTPDPVGGAAQSEACDQASCDE